MESKDKAKQLIEKFEILLGYELPSQNQYELIKQCAIIAVDEIINLYLWDDVILDFKYWQEVKNEIQKL